MPALLSSLLCINCFFIHKFLPACHCILSKEGVGHTCFNFFSKVVHCISTLKDYFRLWLKFCGEIRQSGITDQTHFSSVKYMNNNIGIVTPSSPFLNIYFLLCIIWVTENPVKIALQLFLKFCIISGPMLDDKA